MMVTTRNDIIRTRKRFAEEMNAYIIEMGDEDILFLWNTFGIPEEPTEDDFWAIAEDGSNWEDLCELFGALTK